MTQSCHIKLIENVTSSSYIKCKKQLVPNSNSQFCLFKTLESQAPTQQYEWQRLKILSLNKKDVEYSREFKIQKSTESGCSSGPSAPSASDQELGCSDLAHHDSGSEEGIIENLYHRWQVYQQFDFQQKSFMLGFKSTKFKPFGYVPIPLL